MSFISDFDPFTSKPAMHTISRFDSYFDVYGLSLKQGLDDRQRTITLIAKSPASAPAHALAVNLQRFEPGSIKVEVIFAQVAPAESLAFVAQSLRMVTGQEPKTLIRWAKNRALLDAHERLTLGNALCWTGDSMRRSDDCRSAIDRVDETNPAMFVESAASFHALWKASSPVQKGMLARSLEPSFNSSAHFMDDYTPDMAPDFQSYQLEDYFRSRRH